jgi:hypothetical protein
MGILKKKIPYKYKFFEIFNIESATYVADESILVVL